MKFMQRDFSAILCIGQNLIAKSDNPQNEEAARKLIYGLAQFVTEDNIEAVMNIAQIIDLQTAIVVVARLDEDEFDWAKDLLYQVATAGGEMNQAQKQIFGSIIDAYWEYQPADDIGNFDAFA